MTRLKPEFIDQLTTRDWVVIAACALILFAAAMVLAASTLDGETEVDGDIVLQPSDSGPQVNFSGLSNEEAELYDVFPDDNTIEFNSTAGNITISSQQAVYFNITEINGTWTNATNMSDSGVNVTINPYDKQRIIVNGTSAVSFRDVTLDDGTKDFIFESGGTTNLTVGGLGGQDAVAAMDANGNFIDANTVDSNGDVFLQVDGNTDVQLNASDDTIPVLSNPDPTGNNQGYPGSVSIDVNDPDFPEDNVTVNFTLNGNDVGEDTLSSNGTASVSVNSDKGTNTVNATATDSTGNTVFETWSYDTAENLTIRDVTEPHGIIDDRRVNVTFFGQDGEIVERSTTDGNVTMDNIAFFDYIVVGLEAESGTSPPEYDDIENLVVDYSEQQTVYMLPSNVDNHTVRFTLEDRTGGLFSDNNATIDVQKPINRSSWDNPRWETVFADQFGPAGASANLEQEQRYRVKIRNDQGDSRTLGTYTPEQDETIQLSVGDIGVEVAENDTWNWNATYDDSGASDRILFYLNDTEDKTERIWIKIYEFNNESNVLVENQSFAGEWGTFSYSKTVPSDQENKSWAVNVVVERDGEITVIEEPVGPRSPVLQGLSANMRMLISIGAILIVAGLFSQLNGHIGGLVIAGLGGIFWYINFLPEGTGVGIVILAMVVAAILFIRERARGVPG